MRRVLHIRAAFICLGLLLCLLARSVHAIAGAKLSGAADSQLIAAVINNDVPTVRFLLDRGAAVGARGQYDRTALMYAARNGNTALMRLLLDRGAKIDARDIVGDTALTWATEVGQPDRLNVIRLLLDRGADVNARAKDGQTTLMNAATSGRMDEIDLLLKRGADPNAHAGADLTVLTCAARFGGPQIVKRLLDAGARIETALIRAGDIGTMRLLLAHGADVNKRDRSGYTALHAATRGDPEVIKLLLAHGAQVNTRARDGETPLLMAAYRPARPTLLLLLDHGANVNARDHEGTTALLLAARATRFDPGDREMIGNLQLLIERGADVNAYNALGRTPLMWAARANSPGAVCLLLEQGANANARDKDGWFVLKWAATKANADVIRLLLAHGADPNVRDATGRTPLMDAAGGRQPVAAGDQDRAGATVQLLLDSGADVNASDRDGKTALMQAMDDGNTDVSRLLLGHGADATIRDRDGWTALEYAHGRPEMIALLPKIDTASRSAALPTTLAGPPVCYALRQLGTTIHLLSFAPGGETAFVQTSDVMLADLERDHIAGHTLKDAALSPRGTWLALAIDDTGRDDNRSTLDMPRSLTIVRMADHRLAYQMQDRGWWPESNWLRWRTDNRLDFVRERPQTARKDDMTLRGFSLSGPDWAHSERPVPEPLLDEADFRRRDAGSNRLRSLKEYHLMSTGTEGAESFFVLDGVFGVVSMDGKTIAAEALYEDRHSLSLDRHLIVSRARDGWALHEIPLAAISHEIRRYWLWKNWLIVRTQLWTRSRDRTYTLIPGTERINLFCLDDPTRTFKIAANLFIPVRN